MLYICFYLDTFIIPVEFGKGKINIQLNNILKGRHYFSHVYSEKVFLMFYHGLLESELN